MLTPEQIQKLRDAGYDDVKIGAFVRRQELTIPTTETETKQPGYFSRVGARWKEIGAGLSEDVQTQARKTAVEMEYGKEAFTSQDLMKAGDRATAPLLRAGLRGVGAAGAAAFAPLMEAPGIKQATEYAGEKLAETDAGKAFAEWSGRHPEAAKDIQNVLDVGALLGAAPLAKTAIKGAERVATKAITKTSGAIEKALPRAATAGTGSTVPEALKLTEPVLYKKGSMQAFGRAGKPGGVQVEGLLQKIKYSPTAYDSEVAQAAAPLISSKVNPVRNLEAIQREIGRYSEEVVAPYLKANPRAVNMATVEARLKAIQTPELYKSDAVMQKAYDLVRENMMSKVRAAGGNMEDLWTARKAFDQDVIKQFGDATFDSVQYRPIQRAITDMRKEVNDIIAEQIGDQTFKQQMRQLHLLYEANSRLAEQNYKFLNSNIFQRWAKTHPTEAKLLKFGMFTGAVGKVGSMVLD